MESDLESNRNQFARNSDEYDIPLLILFAIGIKVLMAVFPVIDFILRIVSLASIITCYPLAVFSLDPRKKECAEIIAKTLVKTDSWSRDRARQYIRRINWMGYGVGLFLSIVFGLAGLVIAFLFEL